MDRHLKMLLLIWMRGRITGKSSRFNWKQVESSCGASQKTLSIFLKQSDREFPNWFKLNNPVRPRSQGSVIRQTLRQRMNLQDRSIEWKKRGKPERLHLLKQEREKRHSKVKILSAIFDVPPLSITQNSVVSYRECLDMKLKYQFGIKNADLRLEMVLKIPEDHSCAFCCRKLNFINSNESAIHHCHLCGLIIDVICRSCNALEVRKDNLKNRFIFGFEPQASCGKLPYLYEFGKCENCNK